MVAGHLTSATWRGVVTLKWYLNKFAHLEAQTATDVCMSVETRVYPTYRRINTTEQALTKCRTNLSVNQTTSTRLLVDKEMFCLID